MFYKRFVTMDEQNVKIRQQLTELMKERQQATQEKRSLQRYLETLRECKSDLEYQSRHLG